MVHIHRQSRPLDHNMHTTSTGPQKSEKMPIVIILINAPCNFYTSEGKMSYEPGTKRVINKPPSPNL